MIVPLTLVLTVISPGFGLRLEIRAGAALSNRPSVTISCREESSDQAVIGEIRSLAIETFSVVSRPSNDGIIKLTNAESNEEYIFKPVIKLTSTGSQTWGVSSDFRSRSTLSGVVRPGQSFLTMFIRTTTCQDNQTFMCVAVGVRGAVDSNRQALQTIYDDLSKSRPVIKGGRRCPRKETSKLDECDIYASVGESFDLKCLAEASFLSNWNTVNWYLGDMETVYSGDSVVTTVQDSTGEKCSRKLTSVLKYRHAPWNTNDNVTVTCSIKYVQPNTQTTAEAKTTITLCYDDATQTIYSVSEIQMAGLCLVGVVASVIILITVIVCLICCGRRIRVEKRNKMSVTKILAKQTANGI